jgi:aromatic ring-opening dioxygenase LigB subunit
MTLVYACISPTDRDPAATRTVEAIQRLIEELSLARPETVVLITGRSAVARQSIGLEAGESDRTRELSKRIAEEAHRDTIPLATVRHAERPPILEHLRSALDGAEVFAITTASLSIRFHFDFGRALGRALEHYDARTAVVCTATLASTSEARRARLFDSHYRKAIEEWDVKWLTHIDPSFRHDVAEACLPQTAVLMGGLSGYRIQPLVLSYEAPSGIGLLVAAIDVLGPRRARHVE